jgi:hypothetical protein
VIHAAVKTRDFSEGINGTFVYALPAIAIAKEREHGQWSARWGEEAVATSNGLHFSRVNVSTSSKKFQLFLLHLLVHILWRIYSMQEL